MTREFPPPDDDPDIDPAAAPLAGAQLRGALDRALAEHLDAPAGDLPPADRLTLRVNGLVRLAYYTGEVELGVAVLLLCGLRDLPDWPEFGLAALLAAAGELPPAELEGRLPPALLEVIAAD